MEQKRLPIFSERFAELRGDVTQGEFAEFLGISRPTVGFYENGSRIPDALVLRQIAEKCNVSSDWLLGLSDVRSRDGEKQQVCNYTGLSPHAVHNLHMLTLSTEHPGIELFSIRLINEIAENSGHIFNCFAWKAGLSAFNELKFKDLARPDYEVIASMIADTFEDKEEWSMGMVRIPARDAALFYRDETARYVEIIAGKIVDEYIDDYVKKVKDSKLSDSSEE